MLPFVICIGAASTSLVAAFELLAFGWRSTLAVVACFGLIFAVMVFRERMRIVAILLIPQFVAVLNRHLGPLTVPQLSLLAALVISFLVSLSRLGYRSETWLKKIRVEFLLACLPFVVILLLCFVFNRWFSNNAYISIYYQILSLALGAVMILNIASRRTISLLYKLMLIEGVAIAAGSALALSGLVTFSVGGAEAVEHGEYQRVAFAFGSSNILGVYLTICFAWSIGLQADGIRKGMKKRFLYLTGAGFLLFVIILTLSRRAFLAVVLCLIVAFFLTRYKAALLLAISVFLVLLWHVAPEDASRRLGTIFDPYYSSNVTRLDEFKLFKERIIESPIFGFGPGSSVWSFDRLIEPGQFYFHNYYLSLIYEYGVIGLIGYLTIWGFLIVKLLGAAFEAKDGQVRALSIAGILVGTVVLFAGTVGMTNVTFPVGFIGYAFLVVALIGVGAEKNAIESADKEKQNGTA